jgi:hypothetical protein
MARTNAIVAGTFGVASAVAGSIAATSLLGPAITGTALGSAVVALVSTGLGIKLADSVFGDSSRERQSTAVTAGLSVVGATTAGLGLTAGLGTLGGAVVGSMIGVAVADPLVRGVKALFGASVSPAKA